MPRISKKQRYICRLTSAFKKRIVRRVFRLSHDEDDDLVEDAIDKAVALSLAQAENSRYIFRESNYRTGKFEAVFKRDLFEGDDDEQAWLNEEEFLHKYRLSRRCFKILLDKIKDHPVFNPANSKNPQAPVEYQLMTWLKFVGTEGDGCWSTGKGTQDP